MVCCGVFFGSSLGNFIPSGVLTIIGSLWAVDYYPTIKAFCEENGKMVFLTITVIIIIAILGICPDIFLLREVPEEKEGKEEGGRRRKIDNR